jgi:predicted permease
MLVATHDTDMQLFTDWRTLAAVAGIAIAASVLTGLAPAMLSGRGDLANQLKAGPREGTQRRSRTRVALLVTQGALSVVLLIGAALFVSSLQRAQSMRMGYDADNALFVRRNLRGTRLDSAELVAQRRALVSAAQSIPGVTHAAWIYSVPLWNTASTSLYVPGIDSIERFGRLSYQLTTADFFEAMGTRIVRGRGFTDADREGAPRVAVVSESMARALWPQGDALGQCLRFRSRTAMCSTVVGVAEDIVQRENQLTDAARLHYYLPIEQVNPERGTFVLIRMRADAESQVEMIRRRLQAIMPGESYVTVTPLAEAMEGVQRSWRLGATLFVAFGVLALIVAAVGLYGVVAYNVTQRMHELGVRVALGARRPDILKLVVGQSARLALAGVVAGCLLALFASRWVQPLLFRQSATDPAIYVAIGLIMLTVAIVAATVPAIRAVRADPNSALRVE